MTPMLPTALDTAELINELQSFGARYATVGFQEDARLDDGPMWATSFAVVEWTDEVEQRLRELVRRAAG